jgi:hypothetical protein
VWLRNIMIFKQLRAKLLPVRVSEAMCTVKVIVKRLGGHGGLML